ncbi:MAG: acyl-CoA dehydrogenase family protein [Pseudomonadota bacterium]
MDFALNEHQRSIRDAIVRLCEPFDDAYWLALDREGRFPHAFRDAFAKAGWLGIAMPTEYGGAGLGIADAAVMLQTIAATGAGMSGAGTVHINIFGLNPVVKFGTPAQKARALPPLIQGKDIPCFGVTEPNTGLDTTRMKTFARRVGDHYSVSGQKVWITTAQQANKILLLARTQTLEESPKPSRGMTLFYTDIDKARVEMREIDKMGRKAVDSNLLFFDDFRIPVEDRIGEEGRGFEYMLHGMNPERILIGACAIGNGQAALAHAVRYAKERVVFDRPIGQNQGIQHPLAECWMQLQAASLMVLKAGEMYDAGLECGAQANTAKYLGAEAGHKACETALMTHGGMGYAKEYHVERLLRESFIPRIGPITPQLMLCYIAERVLGLPKSY